MLTRRKHANEISQHHQSKSQSLVLFEPSLLEHILSFVMSSKKTYCVFTKVCHEWNNVVYNNNRLWWPLVMDALRRYSADFDFCKTADDFALQQFLMDEVVTPNPNRFATTCSWREQFKNMQRYEWMYPLWVDMSDGHVFFPAGGWFERTDKREIYYNDTAHRDDDLKWSSRMMQPINDIKDDDDDNEWVDEGHFENETADMECKSTAVMRTNYLITEFVEFIRRCRLGHHFCMHWTSSTERQLFRVSPDRTHVLPLTLPQHNKGSIGACEHSSSTMISRPNSIPKGRTTYSSPLHYYLVGSGLVEKMTNNFYGTQAIDYMIWVFQVEDRLRERAGLERHNPLRPDDNIGRRKQRLHLTHRLTYRHMVDVNSHQMPFRFGVCGVRDHYAGPVLCQRFNHSRTTTDDTQLPVEQQEHQRVSQLVAGTQFSKLKCCSDPKQCHRDNKNGLSKSNVGCNGLLGPGEPRNYWKYPSCKQSPKHYLNQAVYCSACIAKLNSISILYSCPDCEPMETHNLLPLRRLLIESSSSKKNVP